jgi:gentisate 1,2-dioxygenase
MIVQESRGETFALQLASQHLAPLWERLGLLVTPVPASGARAHLWRYADVRTLLLESGGLISAAEAERRVLVLENPGLPGQSRISTSLYAGLQLVLPGEAAPAHRHSQSAMRIVLEGGGAESVIDGEPTPMAPGDLVLTPPMSWHEHVNHTGEPIIWLDALDIPMVSLFDASFLERSDGTSPPLVPPGTSSASWGANLRPERAPRRNGSPLTSYPYARTREVLDELSRSTAPDPHHGYRLTYANPVDGGDVLPTMSAFAQLLPASFSLAAYRSTDATVIVPIEGSGRSIVEGERIDWGPRDVFVVPSWRRVRHEATEDSVLLSYSDRSAQRKLGLWREDRTPA